MFLKLKSNEIQKKKIETRFKEKIPYSPRYDKKNQLMTTVKKKKKPKKKKRGTSLKTPAVKSDDESSSRLDRNP